MARKSRKNPQTAIETPKAFIYATWGYSRISMDSGERSEDSIENQTAIIQDYTGDKADLDLRGTITDLGYTGRDFDRPGYTELMAGIIRGDVQCVVVKDLSRLGRTYIEVGEMLFDTFPAYNVRFISVNDCVIIGLS
jgi:DNA invertase Pin-like site-specific DNA recombinase